MSSGTVRVKDVNYLFIDGGYFRKAVRDVWERYYPNETPPIQYRKVGKGFKRVYYYDCPPPKRDNESSAKYDARKKEAKREFNRLRGLRGFHVVEGDIRGTSGTDPRQKGIDVAIAVDMFSHTINRNMDSATLITGDLDFKPLVEALVQQGMYVTVRYEPKSVAEELLYAADNALEIEVDDVHGWTKPAFREEHTLPNLRITSRPEWMNELDTISEGGMEGASDARLYYDQDQDIYRFVAINYGINERHLVGEGRDRAILERYIQDKHGSLEWQSTD